MIDGGKRTATARTNDDASFFNYSTTPDLSCRKHPSVSAVGICPYCLNDRLLNLVCSECGEQRLSSCSCSDTLNAAVDAGNVARVKLKTEEKSRKTEEVAVFKRSSSSCVEISERKHHHRRFSMIGRFLRKISVVKERALDHNNDVEKQSVSRSRSLCSFRGGNGCFVGSEDDVSSYSGARSSFSAARSSSVNGGLGVFDTKTEHRKSNIEGRKSNFSEMSNYEGRKSNFSETTETRRSNFSESEPPRRSCFEGRKSNFSETEYLQRSNFSETEYTRRESNHSSAMSFTRRVSSVKDSYFTGEEDEEEEVSGFIEIKFDSSGKVLNGDVLEHGGGGSCRLSTKDRELSESRRSFKGWKWIFGPSS